MPIHTHKLACGVTIIRIYVSHPDEVGSIAQWDRKFATLFNQHPFTDYWQGFVVKACNLSAPETPQDLIDYDRATPGFQTADGLDVAGPEVWISFYPPGFKPGDAPKPIPADSVIQRMNAVDHEMGHQHGAYVGIWTGSSSIQRQLTALFEQMLPGQAQNKWEDYAECYRALMGSDECRGFFSNNKPYSNDSLRGLFRGAWYLSQTLKNKTVSDLSAAGKYVQWCEWAYFWRTWYRLDTERWQVEKFTNSGWS